MDQPIPVSPVERQAGLERNQEDLEAVYPYNPWPPSPSWQPSSSDEAQRQYGEKDRNAKRICGLRVVTFWLSVALVIVTLAGAIGGGVGGSLAAKSSSSDDSGQSNGNTKPGKGSTNTSPPVFPSTVLTPSTTPAAGCKPNFPGQFALNMIKYGGFQHRVLGPKECQGGPCMFTLADGVLKRNTGETVYISPDYRFKSSTDPLSGGGIHFDGGFTVCANRTLMLGNKVLWWKCGDSYFYTPRGLNVCEVITLNVDTQLSKL